MLQQSRVTFQKFNSEPLWDKVGNQTSSTRGVTKNAAFFLCTSCMLYWRLKRTCYGQIQIGQVQMANERPWIRDGKSAYINCVSVWSVPPHKVGMRSLCELYMYIVTTVKNHVLFFGALF